VAKTEEQVLAKLDKPPAAPNWARSNFQEKARTRSALINLALGFPQISYQWAHRIIQIIIADKRTDDQAVELLNRICPPSQWDHNLHLLHAFLDYNKERKFDGIQVFDEFCGYFRAGPDVSVPVRPTAVIRENGVLKPIFVVGWAHNGLKYYQRRLLTSIYEDAIYSLTDFVSSPGEVLFFPENGYGARKVDRWHRSSYSPLSRRELTEQIERFIEAREEARSLIPLRLREQIAKKSALKPGRKGDEPKHP
jgi:hypothetical protein